MKEKHSTMTWGLNYIHLKVVNEKRRKEFKIGIGFGRVGEKGVFKSKGQSFILEEINYSMTFQGLKAMATTWVSNLLLLRGFISE